MDLQLKNKTALVSGSTAGIGYAIAERLAREGARVIVNGRSAQRVEAALARLRAAVPGCAVEGAAADLTSAQGAAALLQAQPQVDVLVNNVGIFEPKAFADIGDDDWNRFWEANVLSGVRLTRQYLPGMKQRGWGRVLFVSSESGLNTPVEMIHYGVTKTAQLALVNGLAKDCAGTAVTVNAILPGPTMSEGVGTFVADLARERGIGTAEMEADFFRSARPSSLLRRFIDPTEIAALAAYLASPLSSATTGANLRADGGVVPTLA